MISAKRTLRRQRPNYQIEIRINDVFVAHANVENLSALADISDYGVEARTEPNPLTGADAVNHRKMFVGDHKRKQSVWSPAARVARELARRENAAARMKA